MKEGFVVLVSLAAYVALCLVVYATGSWTTEETLVLVMVSILALLLVALVALLIFWWLTRAVIGEVRRQRPESGD